MEYPVGTLVMVKKPSLPLMEWKKEWIELAWIRDMDKYADKIYAIKESCGSSYVLVSLSNNITAGSDKRPGGWYWHHDWLVPMLIGKNGNPEPYDNQHSEFCYWCKEKTIYFEEFNYCPKCMR